MMGAAIAAGESEPIWLLFGVRHEEDQLYQPELEALAQKHAHIRVEYTLSQPRPGWTGRRGYVQSHVKELWTELGSTPQGLARAPHAYVCGLQRMVGSVRELLRKDIGLPREQVHGERYD
jgi:NAD(P)H-flavin reductase